MLRKENRLRKINGRLEGKITTPLFNISFGKNELGLSRFSFVISKKVDKRATVRNSAKRKVRSVIEELLDKIETGRDFIFYLKTDSVKSTREEVFKQIAEVFSKSKLLK